MQDIVNNGDAPHPGGRPTKYDKTIHPILANHLALLGLTDEEIADNLGVNASTLYEWFKLYPEFSKATKDGKIFADAKVAAAMYQKAQGYSLTETVVNVIAGKIVKTEITKNYPPDTVAGSLWLRNRQRKRWQASPEDAPPAIVNVNVNVSKEEQIEIAKNLMDNI